MRAHRTWIGIIAAAVALGAGPADSAPRKGAAPSKGARDAQALAAKVDRLLAAKWAEARALPVGPADDAEYLRRVSLDLVGKIPTAAEAREFLDDPSADKRARLVERLLDGPSYTARATELWRQLLLPEADTEGQARQAAPAFEAWLRKKVAEGAGYDKIAREVLTAKLGARAVAAPPANGRVEATAAAFYIAKEGKPENLAAGASRVFLGVRLECAQCHNHPFAKWKREEFWGMAAFFAGVQKQGPADGFGAIREVASRRELAIPGTDKIVKAAFLDGPPPAWKAKSEPREVLADWITSPANPYFARAAANRAWARFFGTGLVDPVDDMGGDNVPSHPELLDELAKRVRRPRFRAEVPDPGHHRHPGLRPDQRPRPARPVAPLPVLGHVGPGPLGRAVVSPAWPRPPASATAGATITRWTSAGPGARFLELFADRDEKPTEAQTSILQALTLMNGQIVGGATSLATGDTLAAARRGPLPRRRRSGRGACTSPP